MKQTVLEQDLEAIRSHLSNPAQVVIAKSKPLPFTNPRLQIHFRKGSKQHSAHYLTADTPEEIRAWLFDDSRGESTVCMVDKAIRQGADYLTCHINAWDSCDDIAKACIPGMVRVKARIFEANDLALKTLRGLIFFSRFDDFCVVKGPTR